MPISPDFTSRLPLWLTASNRMGSVDDPFTTLEIQQLGFAERLLLEMEVRAIRAVEQQRTKNELGDEPLLIAELIVHSRLWVFGLYEALRTFRQRVGKDSQIFAPFRALFREIEIARMPLAKHEPKRLTGFYYPDTIIEPTSGRVGWNVFDPISKTPIAVYRTGLANSFLEISNDLPV